MSDQAIIPICKGMFDASGKCLNCECKDRFVSEAERLTHLEKSEGCALYNQKLSEDIFKRVGEKVDAGQLNPEKPAHTPIRPSLKYRVDHLPNFGELKRILALYGSGYEVLHKVAYYANVSAAIGVKTVKFGDVETDTRISTFCVMPSGRGKLNYKTALSLPAKLEGITVSIPTSYHPEQLIGKMVCRKEKIDGGGGFTKTGNPKKKTVEVLIPNAGYLHDDILVFEEAITLLKSIQQEEKECRGHISQALDAIPRNKVSKRQVDQLRGEGLEYIPTAQIHFIAQPLQIPDEIFQQGLIRRPLIACPKLKSGEDREQEFADRLEGNGKDREAAMEGYISFLTKIKQNKVDGFDPNCKTLLRKCHREILQYGNNISQKSAAYTDAVAQTMLDYLVKMAVLLAYAWGCRRVEEAHVLCAYGDLLEIFDSSLSYVEDFVKGEVRYATVREANSKENQILHYLSENEATSADKSELSIADIQKEIVDVWEIGGSEESKERRARSIYSKMKRKGLIADKKGQYETAVWLLKEPAMFSPTQPDFAKYALSQSVILSDLSAHSADSPTNLQEPRVDRGDRADALLEIGKICDFERPKLEKVYLND